MLTPLILLATLTNLQGMPPQGGPGQMRMGGPNMAETKLVKKFDLDKNGWLNAAERAEARKAIPARRGPGGGGPGGPGGGGRMGGPGGNMTAGTPGPKVAPSDVKPLTNADLYTRDHVRTIFLDFENADWEEEMAAFNNTDVEIPAKMTVDGKSYPNVGVHFRGASSFMMVPAGNKRSLNVTMDFIDSKQRLYGAKTLNLLNSNGDASFMSTVLYSSIANKYIPAPKANHVKVVINGESWGVYVNVEQFNQDFVSSRFGAPTDKTKPGARWKVSGSPNGDAGLSYQGNDPAPYKQRYDMKSKDNEADWAALMNLTKVLTETPTEELEAALKPILDIDGVLWFLALDVALANSDGYWVRASDYSIYRDPKGIFHLIPHDMNEAFRNEGRMGGGGFRGRPGGPGGPGPGMPDGVPAGPGGGPGFGGPPPGGGPDGIRAGGQEGFGRGQQGGPPPPGGPMQGGAGGQLDPLVGMADTRKPLRSRLLQVPSLRAKYLSYVKKIAAESLNWNAVSPLINKTRDLILPEIKADTRKNSSTQAFIDMTSTAAATPNGPRNLRTWIDGRSQYLISYKEQPKQ